MKETYYTPDNLAVQARAFLDEIPQARRLANGTQAGSPRARTFIPAQAALLVLDMQAYFLEPESHAFVPSGAALAPGLCELARAFRSAGQPVVFSRHANTPENAGSMGTWWRELLLPDHPQGAVIAALEPDPGEVLVKSQYDAFLGTRLEARLRQQGITQVVIGGVMAHLCCESTARGAFMRGFEVFFLVDGTAAYLSAHHRAALLNLSHGFASLCLVGEVLAALEMEGG